jgi:hypothetical protein
MMPQGRRDEQALRVAKPHRLEEMIIRMSEMPGR